MNPQLVSSRDSLFESPSIIWQGMTNSELEAEFQRLKARQVAIDNFVKHLVTAPTCNYQEYEQFCDTMLTEGVNPNLWIDGVLENVDYEIEALIENANR